MTPYLKRVFQSISAENVQTTKSDANLQSDFQTAAMNLQFFAKQVGG